MKKIELKNLEKLAKLIRYWILLSTTRAGSGHPTSSLSAVELMTALLFGGQFKFLLNNPDFPGNDRLVFSKGHAAPLLYSLFTAAGAIEEEELKTLRKFQSRLEGHPTPRFPYAEAATGSLGQGLSIGLGMALNAKYLDKLPYKTYVLLGDSEMAEGSCWEAIELASYYKLDNLIGIIDVNRLGQRGETMLGHNITEHQKRISSFGWQTFLIRNGHDFKEILGVFGKIEKRKDKNRPVMVIAKTIKGKGVPFLENKEGWHGKALSGDEFEKALKELGKIDRAIRGKITKPENPNFKIQISNQIQISNVKYQKGELASTRKAYGAGLAKLGAENPKVVALDGEVKNSTFSRIFEEYFPERFFEMFVAEQNMAGAALGLALRGKIPFVSTFSAFFSRAFDQIRMAQYSGEKADVKFIGSHAGVSIGEDGPSQMGLEDIALFRTVKKTVILYPSDAVSTEKLVKEMVSQKGIFYLRTTRAALPVIYSESEEFKVGGSKVLRESPEDKITLVGAGITLHEVLRAHQVLKEQGINSRVVDCYSVKPLDQTTLKKAARETGGILVTEDHSPEGGIGEAIKSELEDSGAPVYSLAVRKIPVSGSQKELLNFEGISSSAIVEKVKEILANETERA